MDVVGGASERFRNGKTRLESELALAHYDPRLSTVLTVDASPTGLGAVGAAAGGRLRDANNVADYLSRSHPQARGCRRERRGTCAASADVEDGEINSYLHFISSNDQSSITIKEIKVETQNDPMLHSVVNFIRNGSGGRIDADIESAVGACGTRCAGARPARHSRPGRTRATVGTRSFGYAGGGGPPRRGGRAL
ncbi:hypothetical protein EVAR_14270_1 [Eumeta japonica]|uniref:Uncharacterized protein n=1 Tax=Eumeta variegata TaxID=151549 RepID=A0A4C1W8P9_EUMVA|nr:hypothetical protein EVAR_14270_1 [Eumeta japonica]